MKNLIARRIVEVLTLCSLIVLPCHSQNANDNRGFHRREQVIVELAIEGFDGFSKIEVPLAVGEGRGGGGGVSPAVNVAGYRFGLSVLELRKASAILSLTMTLELVDGTEKKIDERFLVVQGEKREYQFAYGVKIKSYLTEKRRIRKDGRSTPAVAHNNSFNPNELASHRELVGLSR